MATIDIYTLSLHDALPISRGLRAAVPALMEHLTAVKKRFFGRPGQLPFDNPILNAERIIKQKKEAQQRSEEHTSELQSPCNLVCRLLLEKKKHTKTQYNYK